jgi:hypothetical protein
MWRHLLIVLVLLLAALGAGAEEPPDSAPTDEPREESVDARALDVARFEPRFSVHGFSDVTFTAAQSDAPDSEASSSAFALGELSLFVVATLSEHISFLGETIFELEDDGSTVVDVERLVLKYTFSDQWWAAFGRHHTQLGYWNETFHHGLLLQPTVDRPEALKFEDNGGVLPVHTVGVAVGGRRFRGPWSIDYVASIANGRDAQRESIQAGSDLNNHKAIGGKLSLTRRATDTIQLGPVFYVDRIPADPSGTGRDFEIDERILGAHFVYRQDDGIELLSEYFDLRHRIRAEDRTYDRQYAYYAIVIWRKWKWKPYVGIDRLRLDPDNRYFADVDADVRKFLAGTRFDLHPFNVWKLEYRHEERQGNGVDVLAIQTAFTF